MPDFECPSCRTRLSLPVARSQAVLCPECGHEFPPARKPKFANQISTHIQTRRRTLVQWSDDADVVDLNNDTYILRWHATATGLVVVWWSALALFSISIAMAAIRMLTLVRFDLDPVRPPPPGSQFVVATTVAAYLAPIFVLCFLAGMYLCCAAPERAARQRAVASFVTGIACFLIFVIVIHRTPLRERALSFQTAAIVTAALAVLAISLWHSFHIALAAHFQNDPLQRLTLISLWVWLATASFPVAVSQIPVSALGPNNRSFFTMDIALALNWIPCPIYLAVCSRTFALIRARCGERGMGRVASALKHTGALP
jgi:hypothetical protein